MNQPFLAAMRLWCVLLAALLPVVASAADSYREVATFAANQARLAVRLEFRADGDKRSQLRMESPAGNGILVFRSKEWTAVVAGVGLAIVGGEKLATDEARKFAEVESSAGGFLLIEAVGQKREATLRLTRHDLSGGKYPDIVFEFAAAELPRFQRALEDVAKELDRK